MLVTLTRRERGRVTGDLFTSTGGVTLAATEIARRRVVNKFVGNMSRAEFPGNVRILCRPPTFLFIHHREATSHMDQPHQKHLKWRSLHETVLRMSGGCVDNRAFSVISLSFREI